jgi:hypothetical protein
MKTVSIFPILIALNKFEKKEGARFVGSTKIHQQIIHLLETMPEIKFSGDQIKSIISGDVSELNRFLKDNGFSIQLEGKNFELGVVTIMDLLGRWLSQATETSISYQSQEYKAAEIKLGACVRNYGDEDILMIRTRDGISVFIEKTDVQMTGLDLFSHVLTKSQLLGSSLNEDPCNAIVPFIDIDEQPDISWLLGLQMPNTNLVVNQAIQQNKLKLGLDGIHAESAVALGAVRGLMSGRRQFIVDQPFNIWLSYGDHLDFPLFAAYVGPDSWK